jgi:hypothetical protein
MVVDSIKDMQLVVMGKRCDIAHQFIGYEDVVRISSDLLNHTEGAESEYSMRLSGGYGENIGLAKSISVMPGDTVRIGPSVKNSS